VIKVSIYLKSGNIVETKANSVRVGDSDNQLTLLNICYGEEKGRLPYINLSEVECIKTEEVRKRFCFR
jgi:hypothetical protein